KLVFSLLQSRKRNAEFLMLRHHVHWFKACKDTFFFRKPNQIPRIFAACSPLSVFRAMFLAFSLLLLQGIGRKAEVLFPVSVDLYRCKNSFFKGPVIGFALPGNFVGSSMIRRGTDPVETGCEIYASPK